MHLNAHAALVNLSCKCTELGSNRDPKLRYIPKHDFCIEKALVYLFFNHCYVSQTAVLVFQLSFNQNTRVFSLLKQMSLLLLLMRSGSVTRPALQWCMFIWQDQLERHFCLARYIVYDDLHAPCRLSLFVLLNVSFCVGDL